MHLVIAWSPDDVAGNFSQRGGDKAPTVGVERDAPGAGTLSAMTYLIAAKKWSNKAGELKRGISAILVSVHVLARRTCLPLVCAVEIHVEFFAALKRVTLGKAKLKLWPHAPNCSLTEVGLNVNVVWPVEDCIHCKVQGVGDKS